MTIRVALDAFGIAAIGDGFKFTPGGGGILPWPALGAR
jgi:hypothetical protein